MWQGEWGLPWDRLLSTAPPDLSGVKELYGGVSARAFHAEKTEVQGPWDRNDPEYSRDSKEVWWSWKHTTWIFFAAGTIVGYSPICHSSWTHHHVHIEASVPMSRSQPTMTRGRALGQALSWGGEMGSNLILTLRTSMTFEGSPLAWSKLLDWFSSLTVSHSPLLPTLCPASRSCQTCLVLWLLCLRPPPPPFSSHAFWDSSVRALEQRYLAKL